MTWKSYQRIKKLTKEFSIKNQLKELKKSEENKRIIQSIHPFLEEKWQEILVATNAKVINWKGQMILFMDGSPTTIHKIKIKYNKIISSQKDHSEVVVDE